MGKIIEVRLPKTPSCWESCGNCGGGDIRVDDVRVFPGDVVAQDDTLIVLETGKVALDIPSPVAGRVVSLAVAPGDLISEHQLILTLETESRGPV